MIEPGEAAARKPAPNNWKVNVPDTPPAITAKNNNGFIMTYGEVNFMNTHLRIE